MNEAAMAALEENLRSPQCPSDDRPRITIKSEHFEEAMKKITPSVSLKVFAYAILFIVWIFNLTRLGILPFFVEQQKQYFERLSKTFK